MPDLLDPEGQRTFIGHIMEFATKLRSLISERGWSDTHVANAIGVHPSNIGRWTKPVADTGEGQPVRRPTTVQLLGLARVFGVSMESLADDSIDQPCPSGEPPERLTDDERVVLGVFRELRDQEGLTAAKAVLRLSREAIRFRDRPTREA